MSARLARCSVSCSVIASVSLRSRGYFLDGKRLFTCFVKWRLCSVTVLFVTVSFEVARHLPMSKRRPDNFLTTVALICFLLRTTIASQALCTSSALIVQLVNEVDQLESQAMNGDRFLNGREMIRRTSK